MKPDKSIIGEVKTITQKYDRVLKEWVKVKTETIEKTPQDSPFKCVKSMDANCVFIREIPDEDSVNGVKLVYVLQKVTFKVKGDAPSHIPLLDNSRDRFNPFSSIFFCVRMREHLCETFKH